ncbi:MAG: GntR family transcriptional regulator [Caldilinea sp.]|nr:GntR family transcriptional regulator [Caldilinea sp.]MCB0148050.1 GntR family transcriptional regulator [Caldilineaceae bacterium]
MIDKNSPIPRYYQIAELLKEQIAVGELPNGARLPSERELCEQLGVSRMTVRQALTYLQRDGLIEVHQGVGAFVASPKQSYDALQLLGFSEEIARRGDHVESVVLEQAVVQPPARVAQHLALEKGDKALKVMRLRKVNAEPVLLETSYVPAVLCAGMEASDFATSSLYALLEQRYGLQLQRAQQTMECVAANEYEQALFGIRAGAAMLLLEGVTYGERDLPVEYFKAIYRGDRCKFHLESWRNRSDVETAGAQRVSVIVA